MAGECVDVADTGFRLLLIWQPKPWLLPLSPITTILLKTFWGACVSSRLKQVCPLTYIRSAKGPQEVVQLVKRLLWTWGLQFNPLACEAKPGMVVCLWRQDWGCEAGRSQGLAVSNQTFLLGKLQVNWKLWKRRFHTSDWSHPQSPARKSHNLPQSFLPFFLYLVNMQMFMETVMRNIFPPLLNYCIKLLSSL